MCGRSGVGRRNAVSIVSALHHAKLITLKMGKNYGLKQFKQEVKNAMQIAGVENEQVFFLLEDHNLIDHNFLDMVNSLLSSGEIPGKSKNNKNLISRNFLNIYKLIYSRIVYSRRT